MITLPELTPLENTLWLTLAGKALDYQAEHPILRDKTAYDVVTKLGYDAGQFKLSASPVVGIAHRSLVMDDIVRRFVARHPGAVGLDLGAGLDTRVHRVDPPATVEWYDVDLPGAATARRLLLPERPHAHTIGADLNDAHWLDEIPADRPAVIVADGLIGFLSKEELATLLDRLISHFPSGEICFNGYTRFHVWAARKYAGTRSVAPYLRSPGFDTPQDIERLEPRMKLVREIFLGREPEVARYPWTTRLASFLTAWSTFLSRKGTAVQHYRF
ncbi:class I SAM-dependent methyltransferase [Nonomuraea sp. SMC257]|uniref:Class I SAM-dependent methyltransferase n=1 Tax=Nonomuraea montanisoli TaxID=2741721 RepID=A0A7Y6M6D1_9ACTN|nr:class I SAM-dependent methyltransferase [Nonomuraea montanisoli]NUW35510.1 class I SAM-dependent methyltransferase [Nonomuraea montanisoli]